MTFSNRLHKLRQKLAEKGLDAVLISQAENRRYLSSFTGSDGMLVVSPKNVILAVDFRYTEQARSEARDAEVVQIKGEPAAWLPGLLSDLGVRTAGFEAEDVTVAAHQRLAKALRDDEKSFQFVATDGLVESLRQKKDDEELSQMRQAAELVDQAFAFISHEIQPGRTEKQVAWDIEKFLREAGSEVLPFPVIVASGPNSALPHAQPTERVIQLGEPIVMDFGARVGGYCSDFTRTLCLGSQDDTFKKRYDLVLGAQTTAMATLGPGMTGEQADQLARAVINQGGYEEAFGHGLGHGIGLVAHESPRLGSKSEDVIEENMVFTVEPGIYLSGWGGIRIEDTVVLQGGNVETLTKAAK